MSKETLRQELTDWVAAYKDAAERNALAEDPDESAEYLISLFEEELEGLTVIGDKERMNVNIPCETCDTQPSWEFPTAECMDCVVKCHSQAQLSHTIKELRERLGG